MKQMLTVLQERIAIGLVGGSDLSKISEQMNSGPDCKLFHLKLATKHKKEEVNLFPPVRSHFY